MEASGRSGRFRSRGLIAFAVTSHEPYPWKSKETRDRTVPQQTEEVTA